MKPSYVWARRLTPAGAAGKTEADEVSRSSACARAIGGGELDRPATALIATAGEAATPAAEETRLSASRRHVRRTPEVVLRGREQEPEAVESVMADRTPATSGRQEESVED